MDWLVHNPLADLTGSQFPVLYGAVVLCTLVWCWCLARATDPTANMAPPPVPTDPDPYEIAYLRGGENEVMRVAIVGLLQRGHLLRLPGKQRLFRTGKPDRIVRAPSPPDTSALSAVERRVINWLAWPQTAREVFHGKLTEDVKTVCAGLEQRLRDARLLLPREMARQALNVWLIGAAVIVGLGGYKLAVALSRGYDNVGFLILMGLVGLGILAAVVRPSRISQRGQAYLEGLRLAYAPTKEQLAWSGADSMGTTMPLLVGVFGVSILAGTPFGYYKEMFATAASSSGSVGGSSCGSSCGSGDGGGSGCGGCGGGGGD